MYVCSLKCVFVDFRTNFQFEILLSQLQIFLNMQYYYLITHSFLQNFNSIIIATDTASQTCPIKHFRQINTKMTKSNSHQSNFYNFNALFQYDIYMAKFIEKWYLLYSYPPFRCFLQIQNQTIIPKVTPGQNSPKIAFQHGTIFSHKELLPKPLYMAIFLRLTSLAHWTINSCQKDAIIFVDVPIPNTNNSCQKDVTFFVDVPIPNPNLT